MKPWKDWTIGERQELLGEVFTQAPGNFTDYMIIAHTWTNGMAQVVWDGAYLRPAEQANPSQVMVAQYLAMIIADLLAQRLALDELDAEIEQ